MLHDQNRREGALHFRAHFSRDEAEALIPHLRPIVERMLDLVGRLRDDRETDDDQEELVGLIRKVESWGCQVRRLEEGVIDFPTDVAGQPVFFSWAIGEHGIRYYSEPDEGAAARHPLPDTAPPNARPN
jgi:hypothetical protein